jgi:DNA-binding winged helix-turn-helix (wHTH) protein
MEPSQTDMVLDFEPFRMDFDRRQLFRDEAEVHLSPKALQLLQLLIEARPSAVSKTAIQEQLWPRTFVSESNLASIINELRRALDDDAHAPKYIRTVHGFGYAFCGEPVASPRPAAHGMPAAKLVWDKGEQPLYSGRNVIGRDADAAVHVDDRTISRHHAAIVINGKRATIEDLQSKNGTFLEGKPVTAPTELRDGSVLEVGSVKMVFREFSALSTTTLHRK